MGKGPPLDRPGLIPTCLTDPASCMTDPDLPDGSCVLTENCGKNHGRVQNMFNFIGNSKNQSSMQKIIPGSLLVMLLLMMNGARMNGQDSAGETLSLFDGHSLNGWYTFLQDRGRDNDPKGVFTVKDGMIRISGEEWGCITTDAIYENYQIVLEFRWGGQTHEPRLKNARDSGLLLHSVGEDGGSQGIWMHSIECQMIEGGTGDFIVVGDGSDQFQVTCQVRSDAEGNAWFSPEGGNPLTIKEGRINWYGRDPEWKDLIGFRGRQDVEKPSGEWNTLKCIARDDQITVYLNGDLVNRATAVKPSRGRIQIQSEGAEVFVRRVELTPL